MEAQQGGGFHWVVVYGWSLAESVGKMYVLL